MERIDNVTLEEAYKLVKKTGFGHWYTSGNYMEQQVMEGITDVETRIFMSETIFIIQLVGTMNGVKVLATRGDFMDIWDSMKEKYPQLFQQENTGTVFLFP